MKEKFRRFMQGRYGTDELSRDLMILVMILLVIGIVTKGPVKTVISILGWAALIFTYIRIFSKNHRACWAQNQKYLSWKNSIRRFWNRKKSMAVQKKTHRIYTCPGCGQKIRVPKGKGKIEIRCPKCHSTFIKKS